MFRGQKVLAFIPARGGSRRLPYKNLLRLAGKPLISWTIEAAKKSTAIDCVVVSTEDKEIEKISSQYDADYVIRRPSELATDSSNVIDSVFHALDHLLNENKKYDYIAILQPTSPLRLETHIDGAFDLMAKKEAKVVIGVCETEHPVTWMASLPESLEMNDFFHGTKDGKVAEPSLPFYQINGAIYVIKLESLYKERTLFLREGAYAYVMPRKYSIDIDTELDFQLAESLMERRMKSLR